MSVKVRFAPSPTGLIHVGNVRIALMNWLFARREGGTFVLRIDDTDLERSTKVFEDQIIEDLRWLGLDFDERFNQSQRFDLYEAARAKLVETGFLYACYETEEELDRKRKLQRAQGKPPVYDRAALALTDVEKAKLEAEGRKPHWRFKLSGGRIEWNDLVRGASHIDTSSVSDPILIREDGSYLYTLPSVVDDLEAKITHVIRGEDHVTNSAAQIEIFEALGGKGSAPAMAHFPLLVGSDGEKLSKRIGGLSVKALREEEGMEPMAILSLLAKLGTSDPIEARADLASLVSELDFSKVSRTPARFDFAEMERLNARLLHEASFLAVRDRLEALGITAGETFWNAVRPNLNRLKDAADWWQLVEGPITPVIEDADYAAKAASLLPDGELTRESWGAWTSAIKAETGRKGRELFMPLRQALTGQNHGPEMDMVLALIGREKALARLSGQAA
ncbi:MAG TPA: glutamate--tRNA ligase [Oceanicaulis sp.]|jgi:glutamyl-tRNA synthetase|uniref:Glutamate--tRNA ligase n=1 Tax=Glycocaulis albus TaxID=1382801 RepID=A0ABQ1XG98_9PROT|nr:glutamate--tRNA ligase [Glycocaulis albus]MBV5258399.1 glutamate--tRNA ligase [Synechococcus moorigangaii CMS01]GGG92391.1 glutamate--tRNA ligase [Glycocaulis albus]HCY54351.1 glutamate--tRNA ligase [Oceanicaulis sp.]